MVTNIRVWVSMFSLISIPSIYLSMVTFNFNVEILDILKIDNLNLTILAFSMENSTDVSEDKGL